MRGGMLLPALLALAAMPGPLVPDAGVQPGYDPDEDAGPNHRRRAQTAPSRSAAPEPPAKRALTDEDRRKLQAAEDKRAKRALRRMGASR